MSQRLTDAFIFIIIFVVFILFLRESQPMHARGGGAERERMRERGVGGERDAVGQWI